VGTAGTGKNVSARGEFHKVNSSYYSLGSIVAENQGTVENCTVTGTIGSVGWSGKPIGGIVGTNKGTVSGCSVGSGTVINGVYNAGVINVGGIVGKNEYLAEVTGGTVNGVTIIGGENTGGIVGNNNGLVSGWTLTNSLVSSESGNENIGGIVGCNTRTVSDCKLINSSVRCSNSDGTFGGIGIGGIVGLNTSWGGNASISDCSVSGKKEGMDYTVSGYLSVGGIAGSNEFGAEITGGTKNTVSDVFLYGTRDYGGSGSFVGGIVGYFPSGTISGWTINNSEVKGAINAGGIVGYVGSPESGHTQAISNCTAESTVTIKVSEAYSAYAGAITGNQRTTPTWLINCIDDGATIETY
jgi:hypothetical protein